ncbi:MAG TPA: hypothetical protein VHO06_03495, partial [Polyangia bacterium]|nr:hypothetical protein [Polyangia bacterium]
LGCVESCGDNAGIGYAPLCWYGRWLCPPGTFDAGSCGYPYCKSPPPDGCACNPITGQIGCGPILI